jgi:hypothetical protein
MYSEAENREPMPSRAAGLPGLLKLTSCVAAAGATLPIEFVALRDRAVGLFGDAAGGCHILYDRADEALLTGRGDWWAATIAAAGQNGADALERRAEELSRQHGVAEGALRRLYEPVAGRIYSQLAAQFDATAKEFMRCAAVVDPGTSASEVANAGKRTLQAWRDALTLAGQLDKLLEPLCAASELLRGPTQPSGTGVTRDTFLLPLVADTTDLHARVVWHAFRDWPAPRPVSQGESIEAMTAPPTDQPVGSRCGRWGRLLAVGAEIRAHPNPPEMVLFGAPQPISVTPVPERNRAVLRRVDPEGPLPAEKPKRGPLSRLRDALRHTDEPEPEPDIMSTIAFGDQGDQP